MTASTDIEQLALQTAAQDMVSVSEKELDIFEETYAAVWQKQAEVDDKNGKFRGETADRAATLAAIEAVLRSRQSLYRVGGAP